MGCPERFTTCMTLRALPRFTSQQDHQAIPRACGEAVRLWHSRVGPPDRSHASRASLKSTLRNAYKTCAHVRLVWPSPAEHPGMACKLPRPMDANWARQLCASPGRVLGLLCCALQGLRKGLNQDWCMRGGGVSAGRQGTASSVKIEALLPTTQAWQAGHLEIARVAEDSKNWGLSVERMKGG